MTRCRWLALFIVTADQLSKIILLKYFTPGESFPLIKHVLHLTLVFNKGGAFGIFANATSVFILISLVVIIAIAAFLFYKKTTQYSIAVALSCIMAGAASNLIDRLRFGYVIDFIDFRIWPVFNIADSAITLGTLWLVYYVVARSPATEGGGTTKQ